jgi:hypothetical protein
MVRAGARPPALCRSHFQILCRPQAVLSPRCRVSPGQGRHPDPLAPQGLESGALPRRYRGPLSLSGNGIGRRVWRE